MSSFFSKKYSATTLISAPRDKVWAILDDFDKYSVWNSFTLAVKTNRVPGSEVRLTVQMKMRQKPILQTEYITNYKPLETMDWGMNWWPFLKAQRVQRLESISSDVTEYFTEDRIWGLLCPIVHWIYGKHIQAGFGRMAEELKEHVENS